MTKTIAMTGLKSANHPMPIHQLEMSGNAFRLYSYLTCRAGLKGIAWVGQRRIMSDLNCNSFTSISKWLKELRHYGLITLVRENPNAQTYYVIGYSHYSEKGQLSFLPSKKAEDYMSINLKMKDWRSFILKAA